METQLTVTAKGVAIGFGLIALLFISFQLVFLLGIAGIIGLVLWGLYKINQKDWYDYDRDL